MIRADIVIVGAGMAGASLAAEVSSRANVLLIEAEDQPGRHSTGRSAAFWSETYGGPGVQPLTTASGPFLEHPPEEFSERTFLHPRGAIHLASIESAALLDALAAEFAASGVAMQRLDRPALEARVDGLRPGWRQGLLEPSCSDIDVAALHAAYLRQARRNGALVMMNAGLAGAARSGGTWQLQTRRGPVQADRLVNAAGAWADRVAEIAGVTPLGIAPYRRTIAQLRVEPPVPDTLPLVVDAAGAFYFKPESGGRLWVSPHDETPSPACDCAPEELDVARAIDRLQQVVDWKVERVEHSWAGLRSFAPDRLPVYGFAADSEAFFWFAGQGGFGIQTAPAAAKIGAALLLGAPPDDLVASIDSARYAPSRFAN